MVASKETVEQIIKVLLRYVDKKTAHKIARDLYAKVKGSKSVTETFCRIAEKLEESEDE